MSRKKQPVVVPQMVGSVLRCILESGLPYGVCDVTPVKQKDCEPGYEYYESVTVNQVRMEDLVEHLTLMLINAVREPRRVLSKVPKEWEVRTYALERMLVAFGALDPKNWTITYAAGYYGDEMKAAMLNPVVIQRLVGVTADITLVDGSNEEWVFASLTAEYGYVLPFLENREQKLEWEVRTMPRSVLTPPGLHSAEYGPPISYERVEQYKNRELPIGTAVMHRSYPKRVIMVDGRHRYLASEGKEKVKVLVGLYGLDRTF